MIKNMTIINISLPIYSVMIKLIVCLTYLITVFCQIDPPVWPEVFTQAFIETFHKDGTKASGVLHYDSKQDM